MESIFSQTLTDWEMIVCDSFSGDGTWEYFQQFKDDPRVRLYQVPKEGLYAGWNECLRRCRGEYVYIATADDTCEPELLEMMFAALEAAKTTDRGPRTSDIGAPTSDLCPPISDLRPRPVDIAICKFERIDSNGHACPRDGISDVERFYGADLERTHIRSGLVDLLVQLCLGCDWETVTSMVFRRSLLDKTGLFRTDCASHADMDWRIKAVLNSDAVFLPECMATWRIHEEQATSRRQNDFMKQYYKLTEESLRECERLIPEKWRQHPGWREKLLFHSRAVYLQSLGLDRAVLRSHPGAFVKNCFRSAVTEPKFFMRRVLSGFSWTAVEYEDAVKYMQRICAEFNL